MGIYAMCEFSALKIFDLIIVESVPKKRNINFGTALLRKFRPQIDIYPVWGQNSLSVLANCYIIEPPSPKGEGFLDLN